MERLLRYYCLGVFLLLSQSLLTESQKCEPITLSLCTEIRYNETIFPNILGHRDQQKAGLELNQFFPLVTMKCARNLQLFLCSVYVPMCSDYNRAFPPCRHLCQEPRDGCESIINGLGLKWPESLNCDKFPDKTSGELCFGPDEVRKPTWNHRCRYNAGFTCPAYMTVPKEKDLGYNFMGAKDCGAPCDEDRLLYWTKDQRKFAVLWIGCWSILCLISTLFTVSTYLIDMPRFLYPERPIVFLSGCYFLVSVAYIAGFFLHDNISCKQFHSAYCNFDSSTSACPKVVTQGTREAGCTVLFMIVYFFSMASSIWWVILTVTWFLAAGLKWGNEAIEAKSPYFHAVAWTLPALQTIAVLISSQIDGDILSGVCFVGIYSTTHLLWALLVPLSLYLFTGTGFLIAGFVSMFNIRNVVKHDGGTNRVEKLERLMVRIGVFSVLYTVPATVTIACYFYEQVNRESWQRGWLARTCRSNSIPCPCEYDDDKGSRPDFIVFIIKYFMMLIVGITSGFWIWSSKTVESWTYFKHKICCSSSSRGNAEYQRGTAQKQRQGTSIPHLKEPLHQPPYQQRMHT